MTLVMVHCVMMEKLSREAETNSTCSNSWHEACLDKLKVSNKKA